MKKGIRNGINKICECCKKEYYIPQYRKNKSKYCSRKCLAKIHLEKYKEFRFQRIGKPSKKYKTIIVNGRQIRTHRHVMQKHLGRTLSTLEHVHHINGDSFDNRIQNLIVLSNAEHQRIELSCRLNNLSQRPA